MTRADVIMIRNALPEDLDGYRELRLEALKNHPETFGQDHDDAAARDQEYWKNTLKVNAKEKALFVAVQDSQLIGMSGIYRHLSPKSRHGATIWGVYVRLPWRGKHISESLVSSCLAWAREEGLAIVKLAAVTSNIPAIRAYQRCGFTIYGTEPKVICHDGRYYDEYLMSIELNR